MLQIATLDGSRTTLSAADIATLHDGVRGALILAIPRHCQVSVRKFFVSDESFVLLLRQHDSQEVADVDAGAPG